MTLSEDKQPIIYSLCFHAALFLLMIVRGYFSQEIKPFERTVRVDIVAMPDKVQKIVKPEPKKEVKKEAKKKTEKKKETVKKKKEKKAVAKPKAVPAKKKPKKEAPKEDFKKSEMSAFEKLAALKAEKIEKEIVEKQKAIAGNRLAKGSDLVGVEKLEYSNYKSTLHGAISAEWDLPKWLLEGNLKAVALIKIDEEGNLIFKKIISSSGNSIYDEKVMEAIEDSAPFSPPPEKFKQIVYYEGVQLAFP